MFSKTKQQKHRHGGLCAGILVLSVSALCWNSECFAQSTELTSHDNHALLYAHQLGFSAKGAPTVRMRIADNLDKLQITPLDTIRVLPSGIGGCEIELPGNQTYEITISQSKSGTYQYGAVLARSDSTQALESIRSQCTAGGVETEIVPIGSVFALRGTVFDNRENLLMTRRSSNREMAQSNASNEQMCGGIKAGEAEIVHDEVYSELLTYPEAMITLSDPTRSVKIHHQNLIWITLPESGAVLHHIDLDAKKDQDLRLNGSIVITPDQNGKLAVVQSADIETVLRGIVPGEIYASAPEAALMAQAVAARTTLISQAGTRHLSDPYHLCNKQHCQVYNGLSGADPRTDKAIAETRGQVMFSGNKLVQSYYSAHCGGFSAGSDETWGLPDKPYLQSRSDDAHEAPPAFANDDAFLNWYRKDPVSYCGSAPTGSKAFTSTKHARWQAHVEIADIEAALKKQNISIGKIEKIEVVERGKSFRATAVRITGTKGTYGISRELPIRKFFGGLKSALFVIVPNLSGNNLKSLDFYGAGFGHGVGLCQTGAIGMAQRGMHWNEILMHYFPGVEIKKLW